MPQDALRPLAGLKVVELASLAPGPFASMLLADYDADVLRVDRPFPNEEVPTADLLSRGKSSICMNLKDPASLEVLKHVLHHADVFIDPYRPGVIEGLGLEPSQLLKRNPRLIVARLTGFRRHGKYSTMAGHDINYLAVSGILSQLGRKHEPPYPPANILADFAGGGLFCAFGILFALLQRSSTGKGQIIDSNMVDGAAYLGTFMRYALRTPLWDHPKGENFLDGGCPWYDTYPCKDGGYMAVGALEPRFFTELVKGLELDHIPHDRNDRSTWPELRRRIAERFLSKSRNEWEQIFDGQDACCTPVLEQGELEADGYDQRLPVRMSEGLNKYRLSHYEAWKPHVMASGAGGEETLRRWLGWKSGREYTMKGGYLMRSSLPKL